MIIVEKGSAKPKLTRRKLKYGSYELVNAQGVVFAVAHMTGTSRDNYPWDWAIADGVEYTIEAPGRKRGGVSESLTSVIDVVASAAVQYGLQTAGHRSEPERPAPEVKPSQSHPGKFDVTLYWSANHGGTVPLTHAELVQLEAQIAAILHPPA